MISSRAVRRIGPGTDDEIGRQRIRANDQAVIPRRRRAAMVKPAKDALAIVMDAVGLAVHQPLGPHDDAAGRLADRLMAQAHAQDAAACP